MVDKLAPAQRSKVMSAIRGKGTKIELRLAKALWSEGLRYRKNDRSVYGTPDLVFKGKKVAIFVDSEFWHGKDWNNQKDRIKTNSEFWQKKIENNFIVYLYACMCVYTQIYKNDLKHSTCN